MPPNTALASLADSHPLLRAAHAQARLRRTPVLLVGGAVRDTLLGKAQPDDFDLTVQGNAIGLGRAIADALDAAFYVLDDARGTGRVIHPDGSVLDLAVVRGASFDEDLLARDFTINAIAYDLDTRALVDPTHGASDLSAKVLRQVSAQSLVDDPLRALRAVRFAHRLGLVMEPATLMAVRGAGERLAQASPERQRDEFLAMLSLPNAAGAMVALDDLGLLIRLAPEMEPLRACRQSPPRYATVLEHTWAVMRYLDALLAALPQHLDIGRVAAVACEKHLATGTSNTTFNALLRLAALMHDTGKPATVSIDETGRIRFPNHAEASAQLATRRAQALKLSNDEMRRVKTIVRQHGSANLLRRLSAGDRPRPVYAYMRAAADCAPEIAIFDMADCLGHKPNDTVGCADSAAISSALVGQYFAFYAPGKQPPALLNGADVMALGAAPGPLIGQVLEAVREAQMLGELDTSEQARLKAHELIKLLSTP